MTTTTTSSDATQSTTAISEDQSRSVRACQECNRKKTKCGMQRPSCNLCQRSATVCTYPTKRNTPSARKPRARKYSSSQSQRVSRRLERLLQMLEASPEPDDARETSQQENITSRSEPTSTPASNSPHSVHDGTQLQPAEDTTQHTSPQRDQHGSQPSNPHFHTGRKGIRSPPLPPAVDTPESRDHLPPSPSQTTIEAQPGRESTAEAFQPPARLEISYDMVMHLIAVYFEKIQPWLQLFHKPSFYGWYAGALPHNGNCLESLPADQCLLLHAMFSLSARYSNLPEFASVPPYERGDRFYESSKFYYTQGRYAPNPTLAHLQGCILLSFWHYTSDLSSQGWIGVGVCVRLAYELGLSDIDNEDEPVDHNVDHSDLSDNTNWLQKEEKRRAWWSVWELDTFSSMMARRPFAINRRHMRVKLPLSDDAWFSGVSQTSSEIIISSGQSWKSLQGCENQNERAWFLVGNYLMSRAEEFLLDRKEISDDELIILETEISCFKLSLPFKFGLTQNSSVFEAESMPTCNWIIGTRLMLVSTSFMLSNIQLKKNRSGLDQQNIDKTSAFKARIGEICRIVGLWPSHVIADAHPFLAFQLIPVQPPLHSSSIDPGVFSSYNGLLSLVLLRFKEHWKLGHCALRVAELIGSSGQLGPSDLDLIRRFAASIPYIQGIARSPSANGAIQLSVKGKAQGRNPSRPSTSVSAVPVQSALLSEPREVNFQNNFSMRSYDSEGQDMTTRSHLSFMPMDFGNPTLQYNGLADGFGLSPIVGDEFWL